MMKLQIILSQWIIHVLLIQFQLISVHSSPQQNQRKLFKKRSLYKFRQNKSESRVFQELLVKTQEIIRSLLRNSYLPKAPRMDHLMVPGQDNRDSISQQVKFRVTRALSKNLIQCRTLPRARGQGVPNQWNEVKILLIPRPYLSKSHN